jgi:hypothetical protein
MGHGVSLALARGVRGGAGYAATFNLPAEVEDVAIESLEVLVEKVRELRFLHRHGGFARLGNELASPE